MGQQAGRLDKKNQTMRKTKKGEKISLTKEGTGGKD